MLIKTHISFALSTYVGTMGMLGPGIHDGYARAVADFFDNTLGGGGDVVFEMLNGGPLEGMSITEPLSLVSASLLLLVLAALPDIDHPKGTLLMKFGVFRRLISWGVSLASDEHRGFFHSIFMPAILAGVSGALMVLFPDIFGMVAIVVICLCALFMGEFFFRRFFSTNRQAANIAFFVALGVAAYSLSAQVNLGWTVVWVFFWGPILHNLGDSLTVGRVGWLSPYKEPMAIFPRWMRFHTGGNFERMVVLPLCSLMATSAAISFIVMPLLIT